MSTVSQQLMKLGSFDIQLRPPGDKGVPYAVLQRLEFHGHIFVTPQRVDVDALDTPLTYPDVQLHPDSTWYPEDTTSLFNAAAYCGVIRTLPRDDNGWTIGGTDVSFWLGDEDGNGDILEHGHRFQDATPGRVLGELMSRSPLRKGRAFPMPESYAGLIMRHQTVRDALDHACTVMDCEWRANPDFTVDIGKREQLYAPPDAIYPNTDVFPSEVLFPIDTPAVVALERALAGDDMHTRGLPTTALGLTEDVEEYADEIWLEGETTDEKHINVKAKAKRASRYRDPFGNPTQLRRLISEAEIDEGNVQRKVAKYMDEANDVTRQISLDLDDYDIDGDAQVGHVIGVYDPEKGMFDIREQVWFRGQVVFPLRVRVMGATWPVTKSMGVYYRAPNGTVADLSSYVQHSSGATQIEVGARRRALTALNQIRRVSRQRLYRVDEDESTYGIFQPSASE